MRLIRKVYELFSFHEFHLDDFLFIVRPFVYVYSVMQYAMMVYRKPTILLQIN